jgi:hypothetical protein
MTRISEKNAKSSLNDLMPWINKGFMQFNAVYQTQHTAVRSATAV